MAKFIAVSGNKGGTGKSSISGLIGHGCGSLPHPIDCVVITTDEDDDTVTGNRRYLPFDGRDLSKLPTILQKLDETDRLLVVIDGAARRSELDALIQPIADFLVVPYGPSFQEANRVIKDLNRLPKAMALPNRWPAHPDVKERASRFLDMVPLERRLPPVPALPRLDEFLDSTAYPRLATKLSREAQKLVIHLLHQMKIHPLDIASRK